jgi:hypothetical protein
MPKIPPTPEGKTATIGGQGWLTIHDDTGKPLARIKPGWVLWGYIVQRGMHHLMRCFHEENRDG